MLNAHCSVIETYEYAEKLFTGFLLQHVVQ